MLFPMLIIRVAIFSGKVKLFHASEHIERIKNVMFSSFFLKLYEVNIFKSYLRKVVLHGVKKK